MFCFLLFSGIMDCFCLVMNLEGGKEVLMDAFSLLVVSAAAVVAVAVSSAIEVRPAVRLLLHLLLVVGLVICLLRFFHLF